MLTWDRKCFIFKVAKTSSKVTVACASIVFRVSFSGTGRQWMGFRRVVLCLNKMYKGGKQSASDDASARRHPNTQHHSLIIKTKWGTGKIMEVDTVRPAVPQRAHKVSLHFAAPTSPLSLSHFPRLCSPTPLLVLLLCHGKFETLSLLLVAVQRLYHT